MIAKKTFVFFSPYLGHSGSEVLLCNLINEISKIDEFEIVLVGFTDGDLVTHLNTNITYFSFTQFYRKYHSFNKRIQRKLFSGNKHNCQHWFLLKIKHDYPGATWILNTLNLSNLFEFIQSEKIASYIWIHEMAPQFEWRTIPEIQFLKTVPEKLICVSEAVASSIRPLGIRGEVKVIYPGIFSEEEITKQSLKKIKNAGESVINIGMSGRVDVNKNSLFFLNFARYLKQENETRFKLTWLGGDDSNGLLYYIRTIIKAEGLSSLVEFAGFQKKDYVDSMANFDVFLLPSYYDSFPLVMLEASSLGIPIVGWDSGGIKEFVDDNRIGKILMNNSNEELHLFLKGYINNPHQFEPGIIKSRSSFFSKERFIKNFLKVLAE
ncbi:MAG: glycosyltransferase [Bacteroidota bacterium]|nr:glycosyltransferase [Bacteroidota bacterium]